ncbi:hypothetical protein GGX14DRAFT_467860, partial [Mycena pura]
PDNEPLLFPFADTSATTSGDFAGQEITPSKASKSAKKVKQRRNPLFVKPLSPLSKDICARFPSELHDYIVDFLHNDRASLCACRLTCKSWTASSTYHLFQNAGTIHVDGKKNLQFCELLANHPLATCIARLNLESHVIDDRFEGGPDETFQFNELEHFSRFTGLPRLKYLRLDYHHGDELLPSFYSALAQNFSSVTDLELHSMHFTSFADVLRACRALPLLRRLALISVVFRGPSTFDREMYPVLGELVDLVVDCPYDLDNALFCQWLASQSSICRLALGMLPDRESIAAPLSAAMCAVGPCLEHLIIHELDTTPLPDFSPAIAIRTLEITGIRCHEAPGSTDPAFIPALLAQIRSRVIQRIAIVVRLDTRADLDRLDWQRIAPLLAGLESLRRVEFYLSAHKKWALAAIDEKLRPRAYGLRVENFEGRHRYSLGRFDC